MRQCAYSPNGLFIISISEDKALKVWDSQTGKRIHTFKLDYPGTCCSVSMDGTKIVAGFGKTYLVLLSMQLQVRCVGTLRHLAARR